MFTSDGIAQCLFADLPMNQDIVDGYYHFFASQNLLVKCMLRPLHHNGNLPFLQSQILTNNYLMLTIILIGCHDNNALSEE